MEITTERFGIIEINEDEIIAFPQAIPGFEQERRFVILQPNKEIPFSFLQSVGNGRISFIITNPFWFYKDYEFDLSPSTLEQLKVQEKENIMVWSIVTIKDDIQQATLNLQAPIVINHSEKLGMQLILHETEYHTKHKLLL
ncbi:Flagellar assembly factor FliW [Paenibacillus solanacearum]|uniref:Flagellar assembly factor FliW n=1 Tax=Paenibacillus solanacearum TaxID=2048548 RepID=A0A916K5G2_9BACL|nr:flagellar assembly protein FliW [Paenibacillus solanacearum]CAG7633971.1 Flagellar assembly factor FliW [Paenibacillus solanacearum]